MAELICFEALYICRTNGILLMNHSPRPKTEVPNHDDMNTPTKKMKVIEVINPRPDQNNHRKRGHLQRRVSPT